MQDIWKAFRTLSASRKKSAGEPQRIEVSEIIQYFDAGLVHGIELEHLIWLIQDLDYEFVAHAIDTMNKRAKREGNKAKMKAKR